MATDERVRIEVAYEAGQSFTALVPLETASELERRLADGDEGIVSIEAEDGYYAIALRRVAYIKRFLRESRVGFGTQGP